MAIIKRIISIGLGFLLIPCIAHAGKITYSSFYPLALGKVETLRLIPQPETDFGALGAECELPGQIFFNDDYDTDGDGDGGNDKDALILCNKNTFKTAPNDPDYVWGLLLGIWQQNGDVIFLSETNQEGDIPYIGFGVPPEITNHKLTLAYDGSILATGTFNPATPFNVLTTEGTGTRFIWYPEKAALRAGGIKNDTAVDAFSSTNPYAFIYDPRSDDTLGWKDENIGNYSVAFGINNEALAPHSSILGGEYGLIDSSSDYSVILNSTFQGSIENSSTHSVSAGGVIDNSTHSFAGGTTFSDSTHNHTGNIENSNYSVVFNSGTIKTVNTSNYNFIGSALPNPDSNYNPDTTGSFLDDDFGAAIVGDGSCSAPNADGSTILSSYALINCSPYAFIGSGAQHLIDISQYAAILAGKKNTILEGNYSSILGGENNMAGGGDPSGDNFNPASHQFIGGGKNNAVMGNYSVVVGGQDNVAGINKDSDQATHAVVAGGKNNSAWGPTSFIGGGLYNTTGYDELSDLNFAYFATILGGNSNRNEGDSTFIGAGNSNLIDKNSNYSVIEGGSYVNLTYCLNCWAFGENIQTYPLEGSDPENKYLDYAWLWAFDADETDLQTLDTENPSLFIIYDKNQDLRMGIQTTDPQATLHVKGDVRAYTLVINKDPLENVSGYDLIIDNASGLLQSEVFSADDNLDLAEVFDASEAVSPGDVVVINAHTETLTLTKSSRPYDSSAVGVVSSRPSLVFQEGKIISDFSFTPKNTEKPPVALSGQVPCKVSLENGPIGVGDLLTSSSLPGHAMKATDRARSFGAVIGKALEPFEGNTTTGEDTGIINVFVSLQ